MNQSLWISHVRSYVLHVPVANTLCRILKYSIFHVVPLALPFWAIGVKNAAQKTWSRGINALLWSVVMAVEIKKLVILQQLIIGITIFFILSACGGTISNKSDEKGDADIPDGNTRINDDSTTSVSVDANTVVSVLDNSTYTGRITNTASSNGGIGEAVSGGRSAETNTGDGSELNIHDGGELNVPSVSNTDNAYGHGYGSVIYSGTGDTQCNNGIDDDGDGLIDQADLNCDCAEDDNEDGAVYYVCDCGSKAAVGCIPGNDSNSGTNPETAWQTLRHSLVWQNSSSFNNMEPGDALVLCQGGHFTSSSEGSIPLIENGNCRANNRCIIRNYPTAWAPRPDPRPIIEGNQGFTLVGTIDENGRDGLVIRDLIMRGTSPLDGTLAVFIYKKFDDVLLDNMVLDGWSLGVNIQGLEEQEYFSERIILRNSLIINNAGQGWLGGGSGSVIENNYFQNNGYGRPRFNHHIYASSGSNQYVQDMIINSNELYQCAILDGKCTGGSLAVHGKMTNLVIENNIVREDRNGADAECWGITAATGYYDILEYFDGLIIRNNKVINVGNMSIGCNSCRNSIIENNVIIQENWDNFAISVPCLSEQVEDGTTTKNIIRNNTIFGGTTINVADLSDGTTSVVNNVLYDSYGRNDCSAMIMSFVPAWGENTGTLDILNNYCTTDDPGFIDIDRSDNPWEYDFGLLSSAQSLIDRGNQTLGSSVDYNYNARDANPDIGAFEYSLNSD